MPKSKGGYQYWPFSAVGGGGAEEFRPPSAFVVVDSEEARKTDDDMESLTFLSPSVLLGASASVVSGKEAKGTDEKGGEATGEGRAAKHGEEKEKARSSEGGRERGGGGGVDDRRDAEAHGRTAEGREEEEGERGGEQRERERSAESMQKDRRRRHRSRDSRGRDARSRGSYGEWDRRGDRETDTIPEEEEDGTLDETEIVSAVETEDGGNVGDNEDTVNDDDDGVFDNCLVAYENFGDPHEVLNMVECKKTVRGMAASTALVKVEASTISRMDVHIRRNLFHRSPDLPLVPGCDMVGTIVDIASPADPSKFRAAYGVGVGDRVAAIGLDLGGNARYVSVKACHLVRVPQDLDGTVVACLLRSYVTAYQALHRAGGRRIREEDRVLVVGGNGCVGQAAIQIAKAAGAAAVFATTGRTGGNTSMAECQRFLGAMGAVSVGREAWQWLPQVEGKMDVVVDCVCEDGYDSSRKALNPGGKLVCIDTVSCLSPVVDPSSASPILPDLQPFLATYFGQTPSAKLHIFRATYMLGEKTEFYDLFGRFKDYPGEYAHDLTKLFRMLRGGTIRPRIVKAVPLHEVANTHSEIEKGGMNGHIVCRPFADWEEDIEGRKKSSLLRPIRRWSSEKWKSLSKDKSSSEERNLTSNSDKSGKERAKAMRAHDDPRSGGKEQSWGETDSLLEDESELDSKPEDDDIKEEALRDQRQRQEQKPRGQRRVSDGQDSGPGRRPGVASIGIDEAAATNSKRGKPSNRSSQGSSECSSGDGSSSANTPIRSNKTQEKANIGGKHGAVGVVTPTTCRHTPPSKARAAVEVPGILRTSSPRRCGRAAASPPRRTSSPARNISPSLSLTLSRSRSFSNSHPSSRGRQQQCRATSPRRSSPRRRSRSRSRGQTEAGLPHCLSDGTERSEKTSRSDSRSRSQRAERPNSRSRSQRTERPDSRSRTERSESRSKSHRAERPNSRSRSQRTELSEKNDRSDSRSRSHRSERSESRSRSRSERASERPESRSRSRSQSRRPSERAESRTERSESRAEQSSGRDPNDEENSAARKPVRSSGSTKDMRRNSMTAGAATVATVKSSSFSVSSTSKSTKNVKSRRPKKQEPVEELGGSNKRAGRKMASGRRRQTTSPE